MKTKYFTKFCGITTIDDALVAQDLGCNAIGFVFVRKSKRYITSMTCQQIIDKLSPTMLCVGLFANNSVEEIQEVLNKCSIHVLQFHGNESPEFCRQWGKPYWKAIPMADDIDPLSYAREYPDASGYLIDNYGQGHIGGSGKSFDWSKIPDQLTDKWILAGGLQVSNIIKAKRLTSIKCFDVSSGIEKSPGVKCEQKMRQFIEKLND